MAREGYLGPVADDPDGRLKQFQTVLVCPRALNSGSRHVDESLELFLGAERIEWGGTGCDCCQKKKHCDGIHLNYNKWSDGS